MSDIFLKSLQSTKSYNSFDINLAVICSQLSYQSYQDSSEQLAFLSSYNFTNIQLLNVDDAYATMASYGDDLYVAIKGTDFQNLEDILSDVTILWLPEGISFVHAGYKIHLELLWTQIQECINTTPHKNLIITGHSMGGACGQIVNYRIPNSIGYYFGSTRPLDRKIVNTMSDRFIYQIEHIYDIVPKLPPAILGFRKVGSIYKIQNNQLILKPISWKDFFYSIGYTLAYFFLIGLDWISKATNHLKDLIVTNHQIIGYCSDIMACSC